MRYYIRANKQPQNRAELRLVVNAGSVLEDDDQRGLAHFVEHMAFNGTRTFPKQDVIAFLQSTGMRFGAHINANTSFDQTVYELQIPTDSPAVIDRSLLILEDWAHAVSFEPAEIDKERGVILEEWRTGLGAGARILDAQLPVLLKDSRYAERLPIGKPEIIRTFPYDRLKKFYTDWYRPDLMAVIVVGDFDPAAIETLIKAHFGSIPAAASPQAAAGVRRTRSAGHALHDRDRPRGHADDRRRLQHHGGARPVDAWRLSSADDRADVRGAALRTARRRWRRSPARRSWTRRPTEALFVQSAEATTLSALVPDGGVEKGTGGALRRSRSRRPVRLHADGARSLPADDPESASSSSPRPPTSTPRNRSPTSSSATSCRASRFPGIAYEYALVRSASCRRSRLPTSTAWPRDWVPDRNRVVAVSAPKKDGVAVPTEAALAAVIKNAGAAALTAYVDTVSATPLLEPLPKPGSVAKTAIEAVRHHRVDAVERRARGAPADHLQAGRDAVSRLQSRRHLTCGR